MRRGSLCAPLWLILPCLSLAAVPEFHALAVDPLPTVYQALGQGVLVSVRGEWGGSDRWELAVPLAAGANRSDGNGWVYLQTGALVRYSWDWGWAEPFGTGGFLVSWLQDGGKASRVSLGLGQSVETGLRFGFFRGGMYLEPGLGWVVWEFPTARSGLTAALRWGWRR